MSWLGVLLVDGLAVNEPLCVKWWKQRVGAPNVSLSQSRAADKLFDWCKSRSEC